MALKLNPDAPEFKWGDAAEEDNNVAEEDKKGESIREHKKQLEEDQDAAKVTVKDGDEEVNVTADSWDALSLPKEIQDGVLDMGWQAPSKIQAATLPFILGAERRNLLGQAKNGSGKTGCFALGMLTSVDTSKDCVQAVSLAPTQELAYETAETLKKLGVKTKVRISPVVGGMTISSKVTDHIVVATVGKLNDLINKRLIDLSTVRVFVLDEADEFLKDRISGDVTHIHKQCTAPPQVLLFSATFMILQNKGGRGNKAEKMVNKLLGAEKQPPVEIKVSSSDELRIPTLSQVKKDCSKLGSDAYTAKLNYLLELLPELHEETNRALIFVNTTDRVPKLMKALENNGLLSLGISSKLAPKDREDAMKKFSSGQVNFLVSTDVLAKGVNFPGLKLVIHFDFPQTRDGKLPRIEDFQHRSGRVARMGQWGVALSLLHGKEETRNQQKACDNFGYVTEELPDNADEAGEFIAQKVRI